jgi:hypothetical protein
LSKELLGWGYFKGYHSNTLLCQMIYWDGKNLGYHSNTPSLPNDLLGWENFRVSFQYPPPLSKDFIGMAKC